MSNPNQQELPLALPPSPFVREFAATLDEHVPRMILDAGCGTGRNALYLAEQGHNVLGIDKSPAELESAQTLLRNLGVIAGSCRFEEGDIRRLPRGDMFDIALTNETLHMMSKTEARITLNSLRGRTKQGGLNAVSGYVVKPGTANVTNTAHCFAPDELLDSYEQAGWRVLDYNETYKPNQEIGRGAAKKEIIFSLASIVAERPWQPISDRIL